MKRKWIFAAAPFGMAAVIFIGGEVVQQLWNWIAPELFGFRQLTFWQAFGLLVLCRILFGGSGAFGSSRSMAWRRADGRWARLTPEEREHFREFLRSRVRGEEPPSAHT